MSELENKQYFLEISSDMVKPHIIWFLMAYRHLSFQDIQSLVKRSKGTIHFHLKTLIEAKIIKEIQIDNPKHGNMKYYALNFDYQFSIKDASNEKVKDKEAYIYSLFKQGITNIKLVEKQLGSIKKQFQSIADKYEEAKNEQNKELCKQFLKQMEEILDVSTISLFPLTEEKYSIYRKSLEKILSSILSEKKIEYSTSDKQIFSIFSIGIPTF